MARRFPTACLPATHRRCLDATRNLPADGACGHRGWQRSRNARSRSRDRRRRRARRRRSSSTCATSSTARSSRLGPAAPSQPAGRQGPGARAQKPGPRSQGPGASRSRLLEAAARRVEEMKMRKKMEETGAALDSVSPSDSGPLAFRKRGALQASESPLEPPVPCPPRLLPLGLPRWGSACFSAQYPPPPQDKEEMKNACARRLRPRAPREGPRRSVAGCSAESSGVRSSVRLWPSDVGSGPFGSSASPSAPAPPEWSARRYVFQMRAKEEKARPGQTGPSVWPSFFPRRLQRRGVLSRYLRQLRRTCFMVSRLDDCSTTYSQ